MRRLVLAAAVLLAAAPAVVVVGPVPHVRADEGLERARALIEEARPWSRRAGNPDLEPKVRKAARREAHDRLVEARRLFDAYLDTHPGQIESLDAEYCDMASMIYWIRKMAGFHEFDRDPEPEVPEPAPPPPDPEPPPDTPHAGPTDGGPEPPTEQELRAEELRRTLEAVRAVERENPADVPRLHALYEKVLAEFDDPTLPGYEEAAARLGELAVRMKAVFKEEVGADPEAIEDVDSEDAERIAKRLAGDLGSRDVDERRRAARLLGTTNSGAGAFALCKALRDDDADVVRLAQEALVGIGGTRVAATLVKLYRDRPEDEALAALDVMQRCAARSDVDARAISPSMGRFVLARDEVVSAAAVDRLVALGNAAGPGLVEALETRDEEKKKRLMWAIAEIGYVKGTKAVASYLLQGDGARKEALRSAAQDCLRKLGLPTVPYLIDLLQSRSHRLWTALVLREITGQMMGANDARDWRRWWEENQWADDAE